MIRGNKQSVERHWTCSRSRSLGYADGLIGLLRFRCGRPYYERRDILSAHVKPPRGCYMARATGKKRRQWTKEDHRTLKAHSKAKTPVVKISKEMKRTVGALRQQARRLGIGLGHQR